MLLAAALLALAQAPASNTAVRPEPVEGLSFSSAAKQDSASTSSARTAAGRIIPLPDAAIAFVPATAPPHPPLLVLLHGAGHEQALMLQHFEPEADERGIVLLAPDSQGITWDSVAIAEEPPSPDSPLGHDLAHRFGGSRDAKRVAAAIANLEKLVPIDRARTVLAGFSDGATFALAMGLSRDYPFAAVIAWSPGIAIETEGAAKGRRVFVSHGRRDYLLGKADFRQSRLGTLDPTAKEIILQQISFWLHESGDSMNENELIERLSSFLTRKRSLFVAGDVLEKLIDTGLLKRSDDVVLFKYDCFQEYFIALAMKADMKLFSKTMEGLQFLDFAREIELLSGLRRTNDDVITSIYDELAARAPTDFVETDLADFDAFARKEMDFSIDAERLREIKKTRLTEEQVDEIMDEADRRALDRGEEKVTESLSRAEGDLASAGRRRQKQAIKADKEEQADKIRPQTLVAGLELLGKVLRYSEFSDYDVKAPVTMYVIDGWVKLFLRVVAEFKEIIQKIGDEGEKIPKEEQETVIYILGSHLFNMLAGGLNDMMASPSSAATAHELLSAETGLGRRLFTLFLMEDANYGDWANEWSDLLEDASTRGFVVQAFVNRLWEIAHTKSLDVDQSAQVESIVTSIEKRLELTKDQKGKMLQDLRDAATVAGYVEGRT